MRLHDTVPPFNPLPAIAAAVAVIAVEPGGRRHYAAANERYATTFGLHATDLVGRSPAEALPGYMAPDFTARLDACIASRVAVEFELVLDGYGGTSWWRNTLLPILDAAGAVSRVFVTAVDITERKELETAYRESRERLKAVVDCAYDAIITVDADQRIRFMNAAAQRMFGWREEDIVGQPLELLMPEAHRARHRQYVASFQRSPVRARGMRERMEVLGLRRSGELFSAQISISKVHVEGGVETTAIVRDVSETARLIAELQATATSDFLTGVASRRELTRALETAVEAAQREGRPLSLVALDIDHFKSVNDTYGHPVGDDVLREVGRRLSQACPAGATVGRLGGEEFALVLPGLDLERARALAERVRQLVGDATVPDRKGGAVRFTASLGVATRSPTAAGAEALMATADRALYEAKHGGRDRVVASPAAPGEERAA